MWAQKNAFFIQVTEILDGSGYDEEGYLDKEISVKRLDREDFCLQTLRTFYPYAHKQTFADVLQNSYSKQFRKIRR